MEKQKLLLMMLLSLSAGTYAMEGDISAGLDRKEPSADDVLKAKLRSDPANASKSDIELNAMALAEMVAAHKIVSNDYAWPQQNDFEGTRREPLSVAEAEKAIRDLDLKATYQPALGATLLSANAAKGRPAHPRKRGHSRHAADLREAAALHTSEADPATPPHDCSGNQELLWAGSSIYEMPRKSDDIK